VQYGLGQHLLEPVARGAAAARHHKAHELGDLALEAELAVELRGLEVVGLQYNLVTVLYPGLLLYRLHQPGAVALLSYAGWDEEIPRIAGAALQRAW
jgi:hypothetical protein